MHKGGLRFAMASHPPYAADLHGPDATQAIPPDIDHEVEPLGSLLFEIEFLRVEKPQSLIADRRESETTSSEYGGDPACWAGLLCPECGAMSEGGAHRPGCTVERID